MYHRIIQSHCTGPQGVKLRYRNDRNYIVPLYRSNMNVSQDNPVTLAPIIYIVLGVKYKKEMSVKYSIENEFYYFTFLRSWF